MLEGPSSTLPRGPSKYHHTGSKDVSLRIGGHTHSVHSSSCSWGDWSLFSQGTLVASVDTPHSLYLQEGRGGSDASVHWPGLKVCSHRHFPRLVQTEEHFAWLQFPL